MKSKQKKEYRFDVCYVCAKKTYFEGNICTTCHTVKGNEKNFSSFLLTLVD